MNNQHLTDQEVQRYVLEKEASPTAIREHIDHCTDCQRRALFYALMLEGVRTQEKPVFEFDLAGRVMARLQPTSPTFPIENAVSLAVIVVAIFWMGAVFYWVGADWLHLFSVLTPLLVSLLMTTVGGVFVFLLVAQYRDFRLRMKILIMD